MSTRSSSKTSKPQEIDLNLAAAEKTGTIASTPTAQTKPGLTLVNDADQSIDVNAPATVERDEEKTIILTTDSEKTVFIERRPPTLEVAPPPARLETEHPALEKPVIPPAMRAERTQIIDVSALRAKDPKAAPPDKSLASRVIRSKYFLIMAGLSVAGLLMDEFFPETQPQQVTQAERELEKFKVTLPPVKTAAVDPSKSDALTRAAIPFINLDSVDGYKRAGILLQKAVAMNPNNATAVSFLASVYINLVDVVTKDDHYFQIVTTLIDAVRAKNLNLPELVVVEVELYNLLGHYDAAIERIVEFSKVKLKSEATLGSELFYYLALSYFQKGQVTEALKFLDPIDEKNWFSARIPYLYGLIYEGLGQVDLAAQYFEKAVKRSPNHMRARRHLAELYLQKDQLPQAGFHVDHVIHMAKYATRIELGRAHYIKSRLYSIAQKQVDALASIERARRWLPEDADVLFEYYTLRARNLRAQGKGADPVLQTRVEVYELLARGEQEMKKGSFDAAIKIFNEARLKDDQNPTPLFRVAESYRRQGDLHASVLFFRKAIDSGQPKADMMEKFIRLLIENYELKEAQERIVKVVTLTPPPSTRIIDSLYGLLFMKKGDVKSAQAYLKRAVQAVSVESDVYLNYANILYKAENYSDAAFYYGLARRFDPYNVEAITGIGKALAELKDVERGVSYLREQLKSTVEKAPLRVAIAEVYFKKGNIKQANLEVDDAIFENGKFAPAFRLKGDLLVAEDQLKKALETYQTAMNLKSNDPYLRLERYKICMKLGDLKLAISELRLLLNDFPSYPGANYMMGDIYLQNRKYDDALFFAEEELKRNPEYIQALVLKGNVWSAKNDFTKALDALNRALRINPSYVPALLGAGYANHALKNYAAAQTLLEQSVRFDAGNPEVHKRLGLLYRDMGILERSKLHLAAYLEMNPGAIDRMEIQALIK